MYRFLAVLHVVQLYARVFQLTLCFYFEFHFRLNSGGSEGSKGVS